MTPDPLIPIKAAAEEWCGGVHVRTLYREHERGKLALVKVGRSTFVRESEIRRYLEERTLSHPAA